MATIGIFQRRSKTRLPSPMPTLVAASFVSYPAASSSGWIRTLTISTTVSSTNAGIDHSTTSGRFGMGAP
jgi:hypothetical protein